MRFAAFVAIVLGSCILGQERTQSIPAPATLFLNVRVFDGKSGVLSPPSSVLIKGDTIERVSTSRIDAGTLQNIIVVDGDGRVLMPGLIDAHWHSIMASVPQMVLMTADPAYIQ